MLYSYKSEDITDCMKSLELENLFRKFIRKSQINDRKQIKMLENSQEMQINGKKRKKKGKKS